MTAASDLQAIVLAVGRLEGRVGEVVHSVNNVNQKVDAIGEKVAVASNLPREVAELDARVSLLEAAENKRVGALGFGGWLARFLPVGFISAAIGAIASFFAGKHP